jgi:hypothetical protein
MVLAEHEQSQDDLQLLGGHDLEAYGCARRALPRGRLPRIRPEAQITELANSCNCSSESECAGGHDCERGSGQIC